MTKRRIIILIPVMIAGAICLRAGETGFRLDYTTELQTGFNNIYNWVNLLHTDFNCAFLWNIGFRISTISISETTDEGIMDDRLIFSNIDGGNIPLALSVIGLEWNNGKSTLFFGVRNLNEDYFTSPCTSIFTNSSCGIFPTLSINYPLANYPCSSVGAVYKLTLEKFGFVTSLYNGNGYRAFLGRNNVFRFCPSDDGILLVSSLNYSIHGSTYYMGSSLYRGTVNTDVQGTEKIEKLEEKRLSGVLWAYAEQKLTKRVNLLLQTSKSLYKEAECRNYYGMGVVADCGRDIRLGIFAGHADFSSESETAVELTCNIPVSSKIYIQPALHYISDGHFKGIACLFRMGVSL